MPGNVQIPIAVIILAVILLGFFLLYLLIFGQSAVETLLAIVRLTFGFVWRLFHKLTGSIFRLSWLTISAVLIILTAGALSAYFFILKPGDSKAVFYRIPTCTELIGRDLQVVDYACPFMGVRVWRDRTKIDPKLSQLVVMLEDDKFYEHTGLDADEILNSIEEDLEKKKLARGASTITQQLAKNLFLSKDKSFWRKMAEVPLALRLEHEFDKEEILEIYLNTIEWGPGIFGAEMAARTYFDHDASALSDAEA
jgi:membrane peptidoglycan carboxypeptidase